MKRRISFGNACHFIHMIATKDLDKYDKPNAVASIFFMDDYPCFKKLTSSVKHVVLYGKDATEEKALDALTKQIEDFLKEPVLTSGNY
jgi:hypothetical protein